MHATGSRTPTGTIFEFSYILGMSFPGISFLCHLGLIEIESVFRCRICSYSLTLSAAYWGAELGVFLSDTLHSEAIESVIIIFIQ